MALEKPLNVFIVDDDPDMVQFMTIILEGNGHRVRSDIMGATAISDIVRVRPDVVLTDLVMGGVDGLELCRELRAKTNMAAVKIIFVSGKTGDHWRREAELAGADGYIEKPLNPAAFADQIEGIVAAAVSAQ